MVCQGDLFNHHFAYLRLFVLLEDADWEFNRRCPVERQLLVLVETLRGPPLQVVWSQSLALTTRYEASVVVPPGLVVDVPDEEASFYRRIFVMVRISVLGLAWIDEVVGLVDLPVDISCAQKLLLLEKVLLVAAIEALIRVKHAILEEELLANREKVTLGPQTDAHLRVVVSERVPRIAPHRGQQGLLALFDVISCLCHDFFRLGLLGATSGFSSSCLSCHLDLLFLPIFC